MFAPSKDMSVQALADALGKALTALEKIEDLPEARVKPMITIEEMMDGLLKRVQTALTLSFKDFASGSKEKIEVIVSFLAMLELVKQGAIEVAQHAQFGDINMSNISASVPKYG